ncbi:hypothetical protein [Xanthomonas campestris]|uniref:hypothetical protein n=1 Tax=Xanthomonas campestris TaxID=339 RepID=UPI0032E40E10
MQGFKHAGLAGTVVAGQQIQRAGWMKLDCFEATKSMDGQPRYMHRSVCLALKSGIGRGGAYVIGSGHAAANVSVTRRQTGDKLWTVLMPMAAVSLIHR